LHRLAEYNTPTLIHQWVTEMPVSTLSQTIIHRIRELALAEDTAQKDAFISLLDNGNEECRFSYAALYSWVCAQADIVRTQSCANARVLIALTPGPDYLTAFLGTMLAGRIPVPLYPFKQNSSRRRVQAVVLDSQAEYIFCNDGVPDEPNDGVFGFANFDTSSLKILPIPKKPKEGLSAASLDDLPGSDEVAFLQYTSGSTRQPCGVMVRHGNLIRNIDDISRAFAVSPEDRVVTWLPMYHDMGLIGTVLAAMYSACTCIHFSSSAFVQSPKLWLQTISRYRATISGGPHFAFNHCLHRIKDFDPDIDLSTWRAAFCGAEPIRPQTLEEFSQRFSGNGFRRSALTPCYGLAEATLHVTAQMPGHTPKVLAINELGNPLTGDAKPIGPWILETREQWLMSCGISPANTRVTIVDPLTREPLPDGDVGEIVVTGPGVASSYWNGADPANTVFERNARGQDSLRTQDLGFLWKGEVYVSGRIKDIIVVYGRKYHAHDIEATVLQSTPAIEEHGCVALGMEILGTERLVIVAELKRTFYRKFDFDSIVASIRANLLKNEGLQLTALILVRPKTIPKTSSGKLQRQAAKQMLLDGEIPPVACWSLLAPRQTPAWLSYLKNPVLAA